MNLRRKFFSLAIMLFAVLQLSAQQTKSLTLEDFWIYGTFRSSYVSGLRSMNDGENYTTQEGNTIVKSSYITGEQVSVVFDVAKDAQEMISEFEDYEFSANEKKILLTAATEPIYRHSFTAEYFIYDIEKKELKKLSENGRQQLATFSPDGTKIAFVRENNIYVKSLITNQETAITTDGKFNYIINGAPDWVYEEEFGFSLAFQWSPDGDAIAFIKFNETEVKQFGFNMFAGLFPTFDDYKLYPGNYEYKYPKAGDDNSIVSVHVYHLTDNKTTTMDIGAETDIYIPRINWTNDANTLSIYRLNRLQNKFEILFANAANGKSEVVYTETNEKYIEQEQLDNFHFLNDETNILLTSEKDGYRHIYLYNLKTKELKQITKGNWEVAALIGINEAEKIIYYTSTEESPIGTTLYSIKTDGTKKTKLSEKTGRNEADFSDTFKYYINYFSNATTPYYITLHEANGKLIRVLEDNKNLLDKLKNYNISYKEFFTFKTTENVELNGWMIKPANFDATKKYPVLMYQYSGPGSQEVLNEWSLGWDYFMAQEGYIVVCVDGRGTGGRGEAFKKMTYLELGKYETIDQIETAKYLGTLPYVNKERIGIWGWSFGGFTTLLCMTKGADYFKTGIAVAPVTNWRYYDNIYTERFMRKPQENASGYDNNSPINFAKQLKGNLLIVHGTADDNVHVQNTYEFTEALVQANKQFDMQIYTNRNHGIYGQYTRLHLYTKLTNYIKENL